MSAELCRDSSVTPLSPTHHRPTPTLHPLTAWMPSSSHTHLLGPYDVRHTAIPLHHTTTHRHLWVESLSATEPLPTHSTTSILRCALPPVYPC